MTVSLRSLAFVASVAFALAATAAYAGKDDYVFEPVPADITKRSSVELGVRILHKATRKPVEGVVLFRTRLDGSPHNMADMMAKHTAIPSSEPGLYKFRADFQMAGNWAFRIIAKIPGETENVEATVIFKVK